jgi:hypothetical protein
VFVNQIAPTSLIQIIPVSVVCCMYNDCFNSTLHALRFEVGNFLPRISFVQSTEEKRREIATTANNCELKVYLQKKRKTKKRKINKNR